MAKWQVVGYPRTNGRFRVMVLPKRPRRRGVSSKRREISFTAANYAHLRSVIDSGHLKGLSSARDRAAAEAVVAAFKATQPHGNATDHGRERCAANRSGRTLEHRLLDGLANAQHLRDHGWVKLTSGLSATQLATLDRTVHTALNLSVIEPCDRVPTRAQLLQLHGETVHQGWHAGNLKVLRARVVDPRAHASGDSRVDRRVPPTATSVLPYALPFRFCNVVAPAPVPTHQLHSRAWQVQTGPCGVEGLSGAPG